MREFPVMPHGSLLLRPPSLCFTCEDGSPECENCTQDHSNRRGREAGR